MPSKNTPGKPYGSPPVQFRLPEADLFQELRRVSKLAGQSPGEWVRDLARKTLRRSLRTQKKSIPS